MFQFREDIFEVKDLKEGMICPGLVTNVTNFGAFVDVGVHQDGLVHISEMSHQFVDDPRKVVNPGDQVTVRVLAVDLAKNQISFSMILDASTRQKAQSADSLMRQGGGPWVTDFTRFTLFSTKSSCRRRELLTRWWC